MLRARRLVERYRRFLPVDRRDARADARRGLHAAGRAAAWASASACPNLHLKLEGLNPTGSFKDRGMVVAVSKAIEAGATSIICASTGNTSASAAAYGAAAGIEVAVVLPKGAIAVGQAAPGADRRREGRRGRWQLRRRAAGRPDR